MSHYSTNTRRFNKVKNWIIIMNIKYRKTVCYSYWVLHLNRADFWIEFMKWRWFISTSTFAPSAYSLSAFSNKDRDKYVKLMLCHAKATQTPYTWIKAIGTGVISAMMAGCARAPAVIGYNCIFDGTEIHHIFTIKIATSNLFNFIQPGHAKSCNKKH